MTFALLCRCFSWTVILSRFDGSGNFDNRSWSDYETGFGDANGEYWLGNEHLHYLTNSRSYKLRFDLEDWDGSTAYAEYASFRVTSEADKYRLLLGDYSGNASDDTADDIRNGLLYHNNTQFSTVDQDNDLSDENCIIERASYQFGGFWYNDCARVTPTNVYCLSDHCGIYWRHMRWDAWRRLSYSLRKLKMMMRPTVY